MSVPNVGTLKHRLWLYYSLHWNHCRHCNVLNSSLSLLLPLLLVLLLLLLLLVQGVKPAPSHVPEFVLKSRDLEKRLGVLQGAGGTRVLEVGS